MRGPRELDWSNLIVLAQYLLLKPDLARVTCLNAERLRGVREFTERTRV